MRLAQRTHTGPFSRLAPVFRLIVLCAVAVLTATAQPIAASAQRQIAALLAEKSTRNPAQQKIDSHLIHAASIVQGRPVHPDLPVPPGALQAVRPDIRNFVEVDITAEVTPALLTYIASLGGSITNAFPEYRSIRARLPLLAVETVAARSEVSQIRAADYGHTNGRTGKRLRPALGRLRQALHMGFALGPDTSGDTAHQANVARSQFSVDGTGVKIGVLSDGVNSAVSEKNAGRLPAINVISGQAGSGDEGTAMLEIVYTLAPGATLYFATAQGGQSAMANNIQSLANAGCKIIVDDFTYFAEGVFQDDIIARKVESVAAAGVFYFSDAQNSGSLLMGTSGSWEGDFSDSGQTVAGVPPLGAQEFTTAQLHNFGTASNVVYYDSITKLTEDDSSFTGDYELKWSDAVGASANDYDLFILDAGLTTLLGYSTTTQNGTQNPEEHINANNSFPVGARIIVAKVASAAPRALHIDTERGELSIGTNAATFGHNAAASGFTIAAANVANAHGGAFTGGSANPVENFSSDGPRRIFYQGSGTPITPGNFLIATNGGTVLNKPDFTAADGVPTGVSGYTSFFGTSAATPHAGAIAALVLQAKPSITLAEMRAVLYASALDIEGSGPDINSGAGIIMAPAAVNAALQTVPALSITKTHTGTFTPGQSGTYAIVVSNTAGTTSGTVAVTESLPSGLSLGSMSGGGWTCPSGGNACTRTDPLGAGGSYPPITVTVTVASNASSPQVNTVSVSNGGGPLAFAADSTVINPPPPQLAISKIHSGSFTQGQQAATYTLTVSNAAGAAPTSGTVTVTDTVPTGLTLVSMSGTNWSCPGGASCTRTDSLAAGSIYPPITVTVNVTATATSPQVNMAGVSGGGSASASASDSTTINSAGGAPTWDQLTPTGTLPPARTYPATVLDAAANQMIVYGGETGTTSLTDAWRLTLGAAPFWTPIATTGTPPASGGGSAIYDAVNSRLMVFGGFTGSAHSNQFTVLSHANGQNGAPAWISVSPAGSLPAARSGHASAYDAANNRMIVFGGFTGASYLNDVWVLTNANALSGTPTWSQLTPSGGPPPARSLAGAVYDAVNNRLIVFGGASSAPLQLNDLWVLSNANGLGGTSAWTQLLPSGSTPAPRAAPTAIYDPSTNQLTLFGGNSPAVLADVWTLANANGLGGAAAWTQRATGGNPGARDGAGGIYNPANRELILFGGNNGSADLDDAWVLDDANFAPAPDLVITALSGPTTITGAQIGNTSVTVANHGSGPSAEFNVEFYWSKTPVIAATTAIDSGWGCPNLTVAAGANTTCAGPIGVLASLGPGTWYFGAIADPAMSIPELNKTNNARASDSGATQVPSTTVSCALTAATFSYAGSGPPPASQSCTVTTVPSGFAIAATAGTSSGGNWLLASLSPSGSPASSPATLTMSVAPAGLAAGSYTGNVAIQATGAGTLNIPVTLIVGNPSCTLSLSAGSATLPPTGTSTPETCPNNSGQPNCGVTPEVPRSFTVTPGAACGAWTATSSNPAFLQIVSGAGGSGPGTVTYALFNNTHTLPQSYTITVASGAASATYSVAQSGSGNNQVYREVYALYEQLLGRDPDPAGFGFWTGSGGAGLGQMADSFLTSPEAFNSDFAVVAAFQAAHGAVPSYAQYAAAASAIRTGAQTVGTYFLSQLGGGYSANTLYQNLLNRAPLASEATAYNNNGPLATFESLIGYPSNTTPVGASNNEFQSTGTFHTDHTNALYVAMLYLTILSRDPDPGGLAFWTGIANGGGAGLLFQGNAGFATRIQILGPGTPNQGFIGSPEFQGLFAN